MRISIDASGLGQAKTGTAVYVVEILRRWAANTQIDHEFLVIVNPGSLAYLREIGLDARFRFLAAPASRVSRIFWQQSVQPFKLRRYRVDAHWGAAFVLPLATDIPCVVTIHDLSFQMFPEVHEAVKRHYFPLMMAAAVRKARQVLAISATTQQDLHRLLPASIGKTVVTPLAPRRFPEHERKSAPNAVPTVSGPYVICLGTLEPRKNLARLLEAWSGLDAAQRQNTRLLVVGERGWLVNQLLEQYKNTESTIEFTGFVSDDVLRQLMLGAVALAYPSLYEGFGLPVIEAMSLGIPVLTSAVGATREVAGNAALLVDPRSVSEIRNGLSRLISDQSLRTTLIEQGRRRAEQFSWDQTASLTLQAIEGASFHRNV